MPKSNHWRQLRRDARRPPLDIFYGGAHCPKAPWHGDTELVGSIDFVTPAKPVALDFTGHAHLRQRSADDPGYRSVELKINPAKEIRE